MQVLASSKYPVVQLQAGAVTRFTEQAKQFAVEFSQVVH